MRKLLNYANQYIWESDWKVVAVLKVCLLSLGVCLGILVPREKKKPVLALAAVAFVGTYIPLMAKLVRRILIDREMEEMDMIEETLEDTGV